MLLPWCKDGFMYCPKKIYETGLFWVQSIIQKNLKCPMVNKIFSNFHPSLIFSSKAGVYKSGAEI
jgi:hypothetical protein